MAQEKKRAKSPGPMNQARFWKIIALLDWSQVGKDDKVLKPAVAALSRHTPSQIRRFEDILARKLYALDGVRYAENIGAGSWQGDNRPFPVDTFLYVRCCVVANGRRVFESIHKNPKDMPKDVEFEPLLSLAYLAYLASSGREFEYTPKVSYETFSNKRQWKLTRSRKRESAARKGTNS